MVATANLVQLVGISEKPYDFNGQKGVCVKLHCLSAGDKDCVGLSCMVLKCGNSLDLSCLELGGYGILLYDRWGKVAAFNSVKPTAEDLAAFGVSD